MREPSVSSRASRRLAACLSFGLVALAYWSGPGLAASKFQLQSARGKVYIQVGGKGRLQPASRVGQGASVGDHVKTGPGGSVTIITDDGARLTLGENTEVVLQEPKKPSGWRVLLGRVVAFVVGSSRLEARSPSAVAAAEGTVFALDVQEDGATVLTVIEGRVRFFNDLGSVTVLASQQSTARIGQPPTRPIVIDPSSLLAWEASLQTMTFPLECPLVSTDPAWLESELARREQAAQASPNAAGEQAALAEVLLDLHRTDGALAHAQRAVELSPETASAHGVLGYAFWQAGFPSEAEEQFTIASGMEPNDAGWQVGLALVALGQRNPAPAVGTLTRAASLAPDDPRPWAYLTIAYLRLGDLNSASAAASEAQRLAPKSALANSYLSYVRLAEGRLEDAVSAAENAAAEAPQSAIAYEALGTALAFADRGPEARQALDRALSLNPLLAGAHLARAKLLAGEGEIEAALAEAQYAVSIEPESAPAHSTLGLLFLLTRDTERADREFQQALVTEPTLSEARTGWGMVLAKRGRFREAVQQQEMAVSLDTDSASAQNNLGALYASDGRTDEAVEHLMRAVELQPGWGMPYVNLALLRLEQNRIRDALEAGERAVALGERSALAHTALARIYLKQGRVDRALSELRQAVALDDQYPQAHYQLAQFYVAQDRPRDAVRAIVGAVTMDPSSMLESRRYARTEATVAAGSFGRRKLDVRHSDLADEGHLSYFVSGLLEGDDGFREINQDESSRFLEGIAGYQAGPTQQLVLLATGFDNDAGLPGPVTAASLADPDDRQDFSGHDAVLAYRRRLSPHATSTVKYTSRDSRLRFWNPDSLVGDDDPFQRLEHESSQHSPEIRVDAEVSGRSSLSLGYAQLRETTDSDGIVSLFDPATGEFTPGPFSVHGEPDASTAWIELRSQLRDRFSLTIGEYWGRESGFSHVQSPKVVALYRPDRSTWWAFLVNPLFRADVSELAPVEALADPHGLRPLNFAGNGLGRSYEVQFQRQGGRSSTTHASLSYQHVRSLLVDVEDPALTGLPSRVLLSSGHRWVADASHEQWLSDTLSGRAWVRWQSSRGDFPDVQASGVVWPYTPSWQAGARLDYISTRGWLVGLEATILGDRFADSRNRREVSGHGLLDLRVEYRNDYDHSYFLRFADLAHREAETFEGFPQAGRTVLVGLEFRF
ncbi:MAG: tetratricopeptide repeat protein [Armatimonadota bacterium]